MKKLISCILLLALCLSLFVGCEKGEDVDLAKAKELLYTMYKESGVKTTVDYTVVSQIRVGTTTYPITWTADVAEDLVKITKDASGMTLIDVNETPSADVNYTLTGTMTNGKGESVSVGFKHLIPKALGYQEIVDQAYALEAGKTLDGIYTLKGVITTIDTPWSPDYKNITVIINVEGVEGKPIMCYRLKGDGADALKVGDTITVKGSLTNYNGTIEYAAGCELLSVVPGTGNTETTPPADGGQLSISEAIAMGAAKEHNIYTTEKYSVTGVITEVYNDVYGNMKISDGKGNILTIYGTYSADGSTRYDAMATKPVAGDTVTILGIVGQYNNVPQIKNGWIVAHTPGSGSTNTTPPATDPAPSTPPADVPAGATVKFDFTVLTDAPNSGNGYGSLSDAANALTVFNKACTNSGLVSVEAVKAYSGNGTGGAFENTNGVLKLGSSKENGKVVLTFAGSSKIVKVQIKAHGWKDGETASLVVNGSAAQHPATSGTPSVLTFTLDGSSNVLTIEATKRVFIFELIVTFAE